jgi:hypothetical protein
MEGILKKGIELLHPNNENTTLIGGAGRNIRRSLL